MSNEQHRRAAYLRESEYQSARAKVMQKVDAYLMGDIPSIFTDLPPTYRFRRTCALCIELGSPCLEHK